MDDGLLPGWMMGCCQVGGSCVAGMTDGVCKDDVELVRIVEHERLAARMVVGLH